MASIKPYSNGYSAFVHVKGIHDTATSRTKREAQAWSSARETELRENSLKPKSQLFTLADALRRYQREVSPLKYGYTLPFADLNLTTKAGYHVIPIFV